MPTLILPPRFSPDSQRLWRAAIDAGWGVERAQSNWALGTKPEDPVLYGESLFAYHIANELGIALIEPTDDWLTRVPLIYLRREIIFTTLSDAYVLKYPAFVKPANEKAFPPRVYQSGAELRKAGEPYAPGMHVLVSDPVEFEVEYRTFVLNSKIVTASVYIREGQLAEGEDGSWPCDPSEREEAILFAHQVVYRMGGDDTPPAFVLDVGRVKGRGWAVVEANPAWGSGLCGCDAKAVLEVLRQASVRLPASEKQMGWAPRSWS